MQDFIKSDPYQVVWLVRRVFRALAGKSTELMEALGVTASERAVMEFLHREQELTVPDMARRYGVSRQHIQVTVNALTERGLVEPQRNPRHKLSPLLRLTTEGRSLFEAILERDRDAVGLLFEEMPGEDVATTRKTLQALLRKLDGDSPR